MKIKLTELENKALNALWESAIGNGHDFGFIEDLRGVLSKEQIGGVVSSLVKKGIITVEGAETNEMGTYTQFTWNRLSEGWLKDKDGNIIREGTIEDTIPDQA